MKIEQCEFLTLRRILMKKVVVFAAMFAFCIAPICAWAQCDPGICGGEPTPMPGVAMYTLWAKATIIAWWGGQPIEAANGVAYVTLSAGDHSVGIDGILTNEPFNVDYAGSFDIDGMIDFGSYDTFRGIIRTDANGSWKHEFPKTSSIFYVGIGSHTAHVASDLINVPTNESAHKSASAGFTVL
jgi:hypothetical protein